MDTRDFVALTLLANGGEIHGKTKLQKLVYFVGVLTSTLKELGYRAHFYGPYSDDVANAVGQLKAVGVIDQNVSDWGYVRSGFEVKRYDFRLTDAGNQFAQQIANRDEKTWTQIQSAIEIYSSAGDRDYMALSIAAKTYFMLGERNGKASKADLVKLAERFGWIVQAEQVDDAAEYLQKLGLIKLTPH